MVAGSEATNFVFKITKENKSFRILTPGYWSSSGYAEPIHKLQKFLELRSQSDFEIHVEEIIKTGNQIKIGEVDYKLSDLETHKNEMLDEFKNVECNILKI